MAHPMDGHTPKTGYWYGTEPSDYVATLNLLREYRDAERLMRSHARDDMSMNENELLTLRFLLKKQSLNEPVMQRDVVEYLKITGASASALVRQLENTGYLKRVPHPVDRRAVLLEATEKADTEVRDTMGKMHEQMLSAISELDGVELAAVQKFLKLMIGAVSQY